MTTEDEYWRAAEPAAVAEFDYEKNSRSALSAIRGTLDADGVLPSPHYLTDDVQYLPAGTEFELPQDWTRCTNPVQEKNGIAQPTGRFKFGAGVIKSRLALRGRLS